MDSTATGDQEIVRGFNLVPLARNLDLSQFPTLTESSGKFASGESKEAGNSARKLFDPALDFFPLIAQEGK
ncbi:hypothetical protein V6N12_051917 [Hibiscus sabdariffa]